MNIHLPAILGFTRYQGFDPSPDLPTRSLNEGSREGNCGNLDTRGTSGTHSFSGFGEEMGSYKYSVITDRYPLVI